MAARFTLIGNDLACAGELDAKQANKGHPQQDKSVTEAPDVRRSIGASTVADGNVDHSHAEDGSWKYEFEIAKRIEVPEVAAPGRHAFVVVTRQEFRAAQRVTQARIENRGQHFGKTNIAKPIEEPHGVSLHRI